MRSCLADEYASGHYDGMKATLCALLDPTLEKLHERRSRRAVASALLEIAEELAEDAELYEAGR